MVIDMKMHTLTGFKANLINKNNKIYKMFVKIMLNK